MQIDMSNIIDQAQMIIEANGFKDSERFLHRALEERRLSLPNIPSLRDHFGQRQTRRR
jgi:hypothetical protein